MKSKASTALPSAAAQEDAPRSVNLRPLEVALIEAKAFNELLLSYLCATVEGGAPRNFFGQWGDGVYDGLLITSGRIEDELFKRFREIEEALEVEGGVR